MTAVSKLHIALLCAAILFSSSAALARASIDFPIVKLRALDKITARTVTFEAKVGSTVKFGDVFIKVQSCRKAPELEKPEPASFLQIWEVDQEEKSEWIFSGWMFASSPGLSSMDHPIYDVWVLDCIQTQDEQAEDENVLEGEGEVQNQATPDLQAE